MDQRLANEQIEEYRSLREELRINRQYVFERPLLILAGAAASLRAFPTDDLTVTFIFTLFISVLSFNLWFTYNRLQSSARIIGYLHLAHGHWQPAFKWIGWETALFAWRKWWSDNAKLSKSDQKLRKQGTKDYAENNGGRDSLMFYGPIWLFHLMIGIAAAAMSLGLSHPKAWHWIVILLFLVASALLACIRYSPWQLRNAVGEMTWTWINVFKQLPTLIGESKTSAVAIDASVVKLGNAQ